MEVILYGIKLDIETYLCTDMASKLFIGGASEMSLQVLLDMYGEPLPQEISDVRKV